MKKIIDGYKVYKYAGIWGLWKVLVRHLLNGKKDDSRSNFTRRHIRRLNQREDIIAAEIGVWEGSHANILQNQLNIEKFYLIDPYDAYEEYEETKSKANKMREAEETAHRRMEEYENVVWIKNRSDEATNQIEGPLDYVYIDGNHKYDYVKRDIEEYYQLLKPNGIIAGHDFSASWPGVIVAVTEFAEETDVEYNLEPCGSDWYIIKTQNDNSD